MHACAKTRIIPSQPIIPITIDTIGGIDLFMNEIPILAKPLPDTSLPLLKRELLLTPELKVGSNQPSVDPHGLITQIDGNMIRKINTNLFDVEEYFHGLVHNPNFIHTLFAIQGRMHATGITKMLREINGHGGTAFALITRTDCTDISIKCTDGSTNHIYNGTMMFIPNPIDEIEYPKDRDVAVIMYRNCKKNSDGDDMAYRKVLHQDFASSLVSYSLVKTHHIEQLQPDEQIGFVADSERHMEVIPTTEITYRMQAVISEKMDLT